jgi:phenylalanyl-tRNA synthetase beta chain
MRVPFEWLQQYVKVEATAEEVAQRLMMGGLEPEGIEDSDIGPVLDVYVTPNRGDCLSMVGVAREVAALYGLPLHAPSPPPSREGGATAQQTSVTIEAPDLCPRYAARLVRNIQIGPSPDWMQARLEAAGQRPINSVVDVTNYVMLEMGQPLHAFDLDKLSGGRIVVRRAREGETLTTLDGEARTLSPQMLVIADADRPVAVAGVMGGAESEVGEDTVNLLLESAHFQPLSVRRTSRALGLRTEASYRFERVVDPEGVRRAVDRACELLAEIGQPQAEAGVVDIYPHPIPAREIKLRVRRASALLGMEITSHIAADSLRALGFDAQTEPHGATDTLIVHVPSFRADITMEEDLIEEVGRIYGYENIPETLPYGDTTQGGDSDEGRFLMRIRRSLVECGLQEVVTHSLTAPSFFDAPADALRRVAIRNALSAEVGGLRHSLVPGLLETARHNATRGQHALALFEIGRVWQNRTDAEGRTVPTETISVAGLLVGPLQEAGWQRDVRPMAADFGTARGIVERLLQDLSLPQATFAPPDSTGKREEGRVNGVSQRAGPWGKRRSLPQAACAPPDSPGAQNPGAGDPVEVFPHLHPGRMATIGLTERSPGDGCVGEVHPQVSARLELRDRVYVFEIALDALRCAADSEEPRYRPLSRFPGVSRDLAPRVAQDLRYSRVEAAIRAVPSPILESFRLTDVFQGAPLPEGVKSLTLTFTFRASDRTLADAEVNDALARIRAALETECGASFVG